MRRLIKRFQDWLDFLFDMDLSFDGDLMTPDWSAGDGDPVLRPEHKPSTLTPVAQHVARLKGRKAQ